MLYQYLQVLREAPQCTLVSYPIALSNLTRFASSFIDNDEST